MRHIGFMICICLFVPIASVYGDELKEVPQYKLWEGDLYEVQSCFSINKEQPNFELQKKIAEMIYWPEKADVAFLYSQLGNTDPGDFARAQKQFGYWENVLPSTGYYNTCVFGVGDFQSGVMIRQKIADMAVRALFPIVQFPTEIAYPEFQVSYINKRLKDKKSFKQWDIVFLDSLKKWRYTSDELESVVSYVESYAREKGIKLGKRPKLDHVKIEEVNKGIPPNGREFFGEIRQNWQTITEKYPWFGYGEGLWGGRADKVILTCLCPDIKLCPDLVEGMTEKEKERENKCSTAEYKARLGYYHELQAAKNQPPPKVDEESQVEKTVVQKTKPGCSGCGDTSRPLSIFLGIFGLIVWAVWREGVFR